MKAPDATHNREISLHSSHGYSASDAEFMMHRFSFMSVQGACSCPVREHKARLSQ